MGAEANHTTPSLLPTDRPRGRTAARARAQVRWTLDAPLVSELSSTAVRLGGTVDEVLLAVVVALVSRFSRDEQVTLDLLTRRVEETGHQRSGADTADRSRVTIDADGAPSLRDLLLRTREPVHAAPVAAVHAAAAGLVLLIADAEPLPLAGECCLAIWAEGSALACRLDGDAALFDVVTLERVAGCLTRLLAGAVADPARSLMRIDLLDPHERTLMLDTWNATVQPRDGVQVMHRIFEAQAARTPQAVAVEHDGVPLTYGELNARANLLAVELVAHGVGPDRLVGLCVERSPELLVALLAIHKAGGAFLPIDPELPRERVRFMLEDTAATLVLVDRAMHARVRDITDGLATGLRLVTPIATPLRGAPAPDLADRSASQHLAYIIYTSGSTGRPKGALLPHRALCNHALWFASQLGLAAADRVLHHASISFDAALAELFAPLTVGATIVLASPKAHRDILAMPELVQQERITVLQMVPSALRVVADTPAFAQCTTLRYLVSGGEALDGALAADVRRRLPSVRLGNFYGPTEAAVDATCHEITGQTSHLATLPIGRPVANARCRVLDAWRGLVPVGVPGELFIGGLGLAHGYLNLAERTASSFVADPFMPGERLYRTGDLVRYLADGNLEYIGRIDTQVKLRGYRIELSEVEAPLLQHPDVRQAVVALRDDVPGEPQLVAYVVLREAGTLDAPVLRQLLQQQLPAYMVPSAFCFLDALPLTSNAKVDRRALPAPQPASPAIDAPILLPDPLQRSLQRIWERVLGVQPIGPDDDFFALGGHSLKAIRLLSEIERDHGVSLRAATLFDAPTIRALAARMQDGRARLVSTVIPVQPKGARTPLFFAPGAGGELFVFDALARALGTDQPLYVLDMYVFDELELPSAALTLADVAARMVLDIRRVQPDGPYQLAGYSLGGNIVYEIAQQLRLAGDEVQLLALLDCDGPNYPLVQPFLTRTIKHLRHAMSLGPRGTVRYLGERMGKLSRYVGGPDGDDLHLYADQDEVRFVPPHVIAALERALTPVLRAWEQYVPRVYGGAVLLVRAELRSPMIGVIDDDPLLGWGPVFGGGVQLERIGCSHFDILRPEFAQPLADILQLYLASSEPARPAVAAQPWAALSATA